MSATFGQLLTALIKKKNVRTDEDICANDKKGFIHLNGFSSGFKSTRKFLKANLLSMYGSTYLPHFGNDRRSEIIETICNIKSWMQN